MSASRNGKIVTFYSYKGGTGRTMAVANVGWLLATAGHRVLLIDWDFEAPGLHRYLHPFLADRELTSTPGLVDFFVDFAAAARAANQESTPNGKWYEPLASLVRYTVPVQWDEFPNEGALELVPAGRQDAGYPQRAMKYDWDGFYRSGGGVFLEALKNRLRHDYDYILIDSRTGISDTSGISTVQMPDELVVLFTLNQQSILGAAAIADSADQLRRRSLGEPGLRIWPVPTRVEAAEKERLDAARDECRLHFERHVGFLPRYERSDYWSLIEIPYQPYYAYEEVLASFAERSAMGVMLAKMRELASRITGKRIEPTRMPEPLRMETLARFERPRVAAAGAQPLIYASYSLADRQFVEAVAEALIQHRIPLWTGRSSKAEGALERSSIVLWFIGGGEMDEEQKREIALAGETHKLVQQVVLEDGPLSLAGRAAWIRRRGRKPHPADILNLVRELNHLLRRETARASDPEDPQKGLWGGQTRAGNRKITANVRPVTEDYFEITIDVRTTTGDDTLESDVELHLHPTFPQPVRVVKPTGGRAMLKVLAWGAFTVGAVTDHGRTKLELDLAQLPNAPEIFRSR